LGRKTIKRAIHLPVIARENKNKNKNDRGQGELVPLAGSGAEPQGLIISAQVTTHNLTTREIIQPEGLKVARHFPDIILALQITARTQDQNRRFLREQDGYRNSSGDNNGADNGRRGEARNRGR
jgi:hypothetical protein